VHPHSAHQIHEFALYVADLSKRIKKDGTIMLDDADLYNRVTKILRLKPNTLLILFDQLIHARCTLEKIEHKNSLVFTIIIQESNRLFHPFITFGLPLLKKNETEQAVYHLVTTGVTHIQLLITTKVQHRWHEQELERLMRIMIAAAEQSKQFALPTIHVPIALDTFVETMPQNYKKIFFDPSGTSLNQIMQQPMTAEHLVLLVGPEGDLTIEEKKQVQQRGFDFCALTPTILRAPDAVLLGAGIFRSLYN
jgi:16S rRNA (uracil1498-N3)-methyltransferase